MALFQRPNFQGDWAGPDNFQNDDFPQKCPSISKFKVDLHRRHFDSQLAFSFEAEYLRTLDHHLPDEQDKPGKMAMVGLPRHYPARYLCLQWLRSFPAGSLARALCKSFFTQFGMKVSKFESLFSSKEHEEIVLHEMLFLILQVFRQMPVNSTK